MKLNRIIHGDTLEVMATLEPASFACIVTSPPYNLKIPPGGYPNWPASKLPDGYEGLQFGMDPDEYVTWMRDCLAAMMRLLKPGGALWLNHQWKVENLLLNDLAPILNGSPVRQIIVWAKPGGINFNRRYFLPTFEVVYLICGPEFHLTDGVNSYGSVWRLNPERDRNDHPVPFPVSLPYRCIEATDCDGPVLDPFIGSGTTAVAAVRHGRDYVGIEQSAVYVETAEERIRMERANPPLLYESNHITNES